MECTKPQLLGRFGLEDPRYLGPLDAPYEPVTRIYREEGAEFFTARCGHCLACRIYRSKEWKIRMLHELQMHPGTPGYFVTLTYDDKHLPPGGTLCRKDLTKFLKRLRRALGPFRFAACGEYGKNTGRAHYHVIFFGLNIPDLCGTSGKNSKRRFRSRILETTWGVGHVDLGTAENDSIAYVAGYATKKLGIRRGETPLVEEVDPWTGLVTNSYPVAPEFFGTSNRPGLGASWCEKFGGQILRDEFIALDGGKKSALIPRYYMKLLKDHPWMEAFKEQRAGNAPLPSSEAQRQFIESSLEAQLRSKSRDSL